MATSFAAHLDADFHRPVRFGLGEGVNQWGARLTDLAHRLDGMEMSDEVAATLREVFEEAGQQVRDCWLSRIRAWR